MGKDRRIRIRAVRRSEPDIHKLSRALLTLAAEQAAAEAAAQAQHESQPPTTDPPVSKRVAS